ncbi:hypothetical protein BG004_000812 [Podila humilis]|nr:hypothetical protein BG004_000812 [Podila humilis]
MLSKGKFDWRGKEYQLLPLEVKEVATANSTTTRSQSPTEDNVGDDGCANIASINATTGKNWDGHLSRHRRLQHGGDLSDSNKVIADTGLSVRVSHTTRDCSAESERDHGTEVATRASSNDAFKMSAASRVSTPARSDDVITISSSSDDAATDNSSSADTKKTAKSECEEPLDTSRHIANCQRARKLHTAMQNVTNDFEDFEEEKEEDIAKNSVGSLEYDRRVQEPILLPELDETEEGVNQSPLGSTHPVGSSMSEILSWSASRTGSVEWPCPGQQLPESPETPVQLNEQCRQNVEEAAVAGEPSQSQIDVLLQDMEKQPASSLLSSSSSTMVSDFGSEDWLDLRSDGS